VRFDTEQRFDGDVTRVLAVFTDPDLYPTLSGLPKLGTPEVVSHRVDGSHVHLALHERFVGDLPAAALAVVDPAKLTWIEEIDYDVDRATATSRLVPDHYADRLTCSGRYTFLGDGTTTIRRLDGELKVRMRLVGGRVEGALVSGLREHATDEQPLIAAYLAAH
jgi:hypothetical protein